MVPGPVIFTSVKAPADNQRHPECHTYAFQFQVPRGFILTPGRQLWTVDQVEMVARYAADQDMPSLPPTSL